MWKVGRENVSDRDNNNLKVWDLRSWCVQATWRKWACVKHSKQKKSHEIRSEWEVHKGQRLKAGAGGQFQGFYSGPGRKRMVGGSYNNCRVENEKESMGPTTNRKKVPTDQ